MVALPIRPHKLDRASSRDIRGSCYRDVVDAITSDVAGDCISLQVISTKACHRRNLHKGGSHLEQGIGHRAIVLEYPSDFVHRRLLGGIFVRVPSFNEVVAKPYLLHVTVRRRESGQEDDGGQELHVSRLFVKD